MAAKSSKKKEDDGTKLIATNRKARFQYHLEERVEAGVVLLGTEVKAAREGKVNLTDSYVKMWHGEAYLSGCHIGHYAAAAKFNHDPVRERKLLLHRREIDRLDGKTRERGFTLVVTKLYFRNGRVKAEVALARGKKTHDKRAVVKERQEKKEMERALKQYR